MRLRGLLFLAVIHIIPLCAQPIESFDVASIRPSDPKVSDAMRAETLPGGRFLVRNATLRWLIEYAYEAKDYLLTGAPDWLMEKYDIDAKGTTTAELTDAELRVPVRALLADRLKLKVHREMKELPVFALAIAKGGPRLHGSAEGTTREVKWVGHNKLVAQRISMKILGNLLSPHPDFRRTVIDETGLTGEFDVTLEWFPFPGIPPAGTTPSVIEGPSIYQALQDQLGLRLVPKRAADDIIVIDHVERPSEN
jgi:uncharacterized protein (TIGR03435 family)